MTPAQEAAMRQALEALELVTDLTNHDDEIYDAIDALRAVLAEHQESWEHLMRYGYAPGNYMSRCHICDKIASGVDKRAITCRPCAEVRHAESQKAETVREHDTDCHAQGICQRSGYSIRQHSAPPRRKPLTEGDMYIVEEEAMKNFHLSQSGPQGQMITYWDSLTPWLIRAVERAHDIKE